jgi:hypothetical protein
MSVEKFYAFFHGFSLQQLSKKLHGSYKPSFSKGAFMKRSIIGLILFAAQIGFAKTTDLPCSSYYYRVGSEGDFEWFVGSGKIVTTKQSGWKKIEIVLDGITDRSPSKRLEFDVRENVVSSKDPITGEIQTYEIQGHFELKDGFARDGYSSVIGLNGKPDNSVENQKSRRESVCEGN